MSAQEEIDNLKHFIDNEKDSIEYYARQAGNAMACLETSIAKLKRYEERLAAELSQVKA